MAKRRDDDTPWCTIHDEPETSCQGRDHGPKSLQGQAELRRRKAIARWSAPAGRRANRARR